MTIDSNYLMMAATANSEIQSLLNQLQSEGVDTTKANYYINSIYTVGQDGFIAANGNEYQQSMAVQDMLLKLSELVGMVALGGKNANKKVKSNDAAIKSTENNAQKLYQNTESKLQKILSDCNGNAEKIRGLIEEIEKLGGGEDGEVAKVQEELEAQLQIIEDNKRILNDDNTDPTARKSAISAILGAASVINGLTEKITTIKAKIEEKNAEMAQVQEDNANLMVSAQEVVTESVQGIQETSAEYAKESVATTQLGAEGGTREAVGTTEVATGTAMTNNAVTMKEGIKLQKQGNNNITEGQTLMQGSVSGIKELASGTGEIGSFTGKLNDYTQGIGQFNDGFMELVGAYDTLIQPMITAVGSYDNIADANTQLQDYVNNYTTEVIGEDVENNGDVKDIDKVDENSIKKKNFEFDTKIFRTSQT